MALRRPSAEDLRRLAAAHHFEVTSEEVDAYLSLLPDIFASLEVFAQAPSNLPPITYRDRDPGRRPSRQEDPLNAIVRRCSVKGAKTGKLAGKKIGIKDNVCIAGVPMTCASLVLEGYVPDIDATIITRILDAGGEITAVLNMDNFAFSGGGDTSAYGPTRNPHNEGATCRAQTKRSPACALHNCTLKGKSLYRALVRKRTLQTILPVVQSCAALPAASPARVHARGRRILPMRQNRRCSAPARHRLMSPDPQTLRAHARQWR